MFGHVTGAFLTALGNLASKSPTGWMTGTAGSVWSAARGASGKGKQAFKSSQLRDIFDDIKYSGNRTPDDFSPQKINDWFNTRIFGRAEEVPISGSSHSWLNYEPNAGMGHNLREFAGKHWVKGAVGAAGVYGINRLDEGIGSLYGGPGYGGYLGYGEGAHSERNALEGAVTNMNYQGQMMGLQALSSNQVAPQYSLTIAPMRQRRASAALRDSTQGLALGLHKGRHGGY